MREKIFSLVLSVMIVAGTGITEVFAGSSMPVTGDQNSAGIYIAVGCAAVAFIVLLLFNNKDKH